MSDQIRCVISVDVDGALKFEVPRTITVESYTKIEAEVADGATVDVTLPGTASDFVFLLITSSVYGATLTFGDATTLLPLSGPLLLFGGELAGALTAPVLGSTLRFVNSSGAPATIQIVAGLNVVTAI